MSSTERNYRVVGLSPENTVIVQVEGRSGLTDLGVKPSMLGTWGLTRAEVGILRRGMTSAGRDRTTPKR